MERLVSRLRKIGRRILRLPRSRKHLSRTQLRFCEWNARRLGISEERAISILSESTSALPGGHEGRAFRQYCSVSYQLYRPFADDSEDRVFDAYQFHGHMHFLRMLSYPDPRIHENDPVLRCINGIQSPVIVDFGCGLAGYSRALCERLVAGKVAPRLVLTDVPTLRAEFLTWLGGMDDYSIEFLPCTKDRPIPDLPNCDVLVATEVFEHLHCPVSYLDRFDACLNPGGLLYTGIDDHEKEFMHVSPMLADVRQRLSELSYAILRRNRVYQKPGTLRHGGSQPSSQHCQ